MKADNIAGRESRKKQKEEASKFACIKVDN